MQSLLTRAVALFGDDDAERDNALLALTDTFYWTSDQAQAPLLVEQVVRSAERRGDAAMLARARIAQHDIALWTDAAAPADELLVDIDRAIAVLESAADHRGLAEAYQVRFHALDRGTSATDPIDALESALRHARLAGSVLLEGWAQSWLCIVLPYGGMPLRESLVYAEEVIRTAPNQAVRAAGLGATGLLRAMQGEFDDARRLVREDQSILAELGLRQSHAAHSIAMAEVEILADDLAAAEELLRWGYERIVPLRDNHSISNVAWRLARVLSRTGRDEEAERFTHVAEETTPHGFWVDVWWRMLRAGVAARVGNGAAADELLRRALSMIQTHGETRMAVDVWIAAGDALRDLGRDDDAEQLLERAGALATVLGYEVAERRVAELKRRSAGTARPRPATRSRAPAEDA